MHWRWVITFWLGCAGLLLTARAADGTSLTPSQQLVQAVRYGQLAETRRWLAAGADPNYHEPDEASALYSACQQGNSDLAGLLLEAGANVALGEPHGDQPLHAAAQLADPAVVRLLLEHGAEVNARGYNGATALLLAAQANSQSCAAALMDAGADVDAADIFGWTPLCEVAGFGNLNADGGLGIATLLLEHDAQLDLKAQKPAGVTALHIAALKNKPWLIALLVRSGADINAANAFGNTPLHIAGKYNCIDAKEVLHELGARVDDIYLAAAVDDPVVAERLLLSGQGSFVDWEGEPPLGWAIRNNSMAVVRVLLAHPQEAGTKQEELDLALLLACQFSQPVLATMLLDAGANPAMLDGHGDHLLASTLDERVIQVLVARGADLYARNHLGQTLLHSAAAADRSDTLGSLLLWGLPADLPDADGTTPLFVAIDALESEGGSSLAIERLVEAGASPQQRDSAGNTPLHRLAALRAAGPWSVYLAAQALVTAGADVNALNASGESVLDGCSEAQLQQKDKKASLPDYLVSVGARHSAGWLRRHGVYVPSFVLEPGRADAHGYEPWQHAVTLPAAPPVMHP